MKIEKDGNDSVSHEHKKEICHLPQGHGPANEQYTLE